MSLYCTECAAPLKEHATHCLECGAVTRSGSIATATRNTAGVPPQPVYSSAQSLTGTAGDNGLGYEPALLTQWMEHWRKQSPAIPVPNPSRLDPGSILVRLVYFVLIGMWASQLWIIVTWLLSLTVVGLPISTAMIRVLPQVAMLSSRRIRPASLAQAKYSAQAAFGVRALYFLLIGWWASFVWMQLAWVAGITIIGLPLALAMFSFTPTVATLARS